MKTQRKKLVAWLFKITQHIYTKYFKKNKPWHIKKQQLLQFPKDTFGYHLGLFLQHNGFELIPKVERHDAYHVMTGYNTTEEDEIALQYLCFGNGKRSIYLFGVITIGSLILPEYWKYYIKSYRIGKNANVFYNLNYKGLLNTSVSTLRSSIFINLNY
ncbi:MAG: Coq4 family protein [Olleya sp.]